MQRNKALNIIIDTNLWISFLISHRQDRLDKLLLSNRIKILFSSELLDEISVTIAKPKIKKYFGSDALNEMLLNLEGYIEFIEVKSAVSICRDNKDNFLLALAKDGHADFLLSGDNDLLDLKKFGKTKIVSITSFIESIHDKF